MLVYLWRSKKLVLLVKAAPAWRHGRGNLSRGRGKLEDVSWSIYCSWIDESDELWWTPGSETVSDESVTSSRHGFMMSRRKHKQGPLKMCWIMTPLNSNLCSCSTSTNCTFILLRFMFGGVAVAQGVFLSSAAWDKRFNLVRPSRYTDRSISTSTCQPGSDAAQSMAPRRSPSSHRDPLLLCLLVYRPNLSWMAASDRSS